MGQTIGDAGEESSGQLQFQMQPSREVRHEMLITESLHTQMRCEDTAESWHCSVGTSRQGGPQRQVLQQPPPSELKGGESNVSNDGEVAMKYRSMTMLKDRNRSVKGSEDGSS